MLLTRFGTINFDWSNVLSKLKLTKKLRKLFKAKCYKKITSEIISIQNTNYSLSLYYYSLSWNTVFIF